MNYFLLEAFKIWNIGRFKFTKRFFQNSRRMENPNNAIIFTWINSGLVSIYPRLGHWLIMEIFGQNPELTHCKNKLKSIFRREKIRFRDHIKTNNFHVTNSLNELNITISII